MSQTQISWERELLFFCKAACIFNGLHEEKKNVLKITGQELLLKFWLHINRYQDSYWLQVEWKLQTMEETKQSKENETQRKKLSETLQVATTKAYIARKRQRIIRMWDKTETESFTSILCHSRCIQDRNAFQNMCTLDRKWEDK